MLLLRDIQEILGCFGFFFSSSFTVGYSVDDGGSTVDSQFIWASARLNGHEPHSVINVPGIDLRPQTGPCLMLGHV